MKDELIEQLTKRVPELEWKLSKLGSFINKSLLPRGLFRNAELGTPESCADEIKADLATLKQQMNEQRACYLARQISQKINVLVSICQMSTSKQKQKSTKEAAPPFSLQAINTRQQWIKTRLLETEKRKEQRQALLERLQRAQLNQDSKSILALQKELGEVDRLLTIAKEMKEY